MVSRRETGAPAALPCYEWPLACPPIISPTRRPQDHTIPHHPARSVLTLVEHLTRAVVGFDGPFTHPPMRIECQYLHRPDSLCRSSNPAAWEAVAMGKQKIKLNYRRRVLRLPDLE